MQGVLHTSPVTEAGKSTLLFEKQYLTFHIRNRDDPSGYLLFAVPFLPSNGMPYADSTSTNSWTPILSNANLSACPGGCFRPAGLAWDSKGRLYMTSDSTGEIYIITATDGSGVDGVNVTTSTGSASGASPSETRTSAGARNVQDGSLALVLCVSVLLALF